MGYRPPLTAVGRGPAFASGPVQLEAVCAGLGKLPPWVRRYRKST